MKNELLDIAGNSNQKGSNDLPQKKDSTTIEPYVGSTEVAGFLGISPRMLRTAVKKACLPMKSAAGSISGCRRSKRGSKAEDRL